MDENNELDGTLVVKQYQPITIFSESFNDARSKALQSFFTGITPQSAIKERAGRGGGKVKYVTGYHMIEQISLITNFRWSHKRITEEYRPNKENPIEIITDVEVTIWDNNGNSYSHPGTGSKDVARYASDVYTKQWINGKEQFIDLGLDETDMMWQQEKRKQYHRYEIAHKRGDIISLGDDRKAAETDAIKKALSYFGIARDVYGHKEASVVDETTEEESEEAKKQREAVESFKRWLIHVHVRWSEVFEILGISDATEIVDFNEAQRKIIEAKGLKEEKDDKI